RASLAAGLCVLLVITTGCGHFRRARAFYQKPASPRQLGSLTDPIWSNQESNAEASDFVVYNHEFKYQSAKMNEAGQDHMKQLASRILDGQDMLVMIERSWTASREDTEYQYPVHTDPEL